MAALKDNSPRGSSVDSNSVKSREDETDRKFCCVVYPDAQDYNIVSVLENVECVHQWAYILHDKDVNDDGELKKEHYHVLIRFVSPRKLSTCANFLGIDSQYVQRCKSFKSSERYLVHRTPDSFDKYQYSVKDVFTNIDTFSADVGETNECTALSFIYELLDSGKYTLPQLARYLACQYKDPLVYASFRRNFSILKYVEDARKCAESEKAWADIRYTPHVSVDMNLINQIFKETKHES